jgi:Sulfatase
MKDTAMKTTTLILLAALLLLSTALQTAEPTKPNILVILADDLAYGDVGFNCCKDIPTPHIDSIANNGARLSSSASVMR